MRLRVGIPDFRLGTNINQIDVPKQLRIRHLTGIGWFDDALSGGFVPSAVYMLTGMPACGKSTLLRQVADSLKGEGHEVLYNTGEESLYQVKLMCERMRLRNGFTCGQDTLIERVLDHVRQLQQIQCRGKQTFLLVDSLQTCDDGRYGGAMNSTTAVNCAAAMIDWAKDTFGTVVFIGQCTKSGDYVGKSTVKHAVDGQIHIAIDNDKRSDTFGERLLTIPKNRFGTSGMTIIVGMDDRGLTERGRFSNG